MGEAAPTGWLGVGWPVGPPVPWPRAMHRARCPPRAVFLVRRLPGWCPVPLLARWARGLPPVRAPPVAARATFFFRRGRAFFSEKHCAPNIAHLAISLREAAGVWISLDAFEPTPRPLDGISRCSPVAWESAYVSSTTPLRRVPWPCLMLVFAPRAAISPSHTPPSTAGGHF